MSSRTRRIGDLSFCHLKAQALFACKGMDLTARMLQEPTKPCDLTGDAQSQGLIKKLLDVRHEATHGDPNKRPVPECSPLLAGAFSNLPDEPHGQEWTRWAVLCLS